MKIAEHNTHYSGHVVTLRWRHGGFDVDAITSFFTHDFSRHATKFHIEASRPGNLACYVEAHVPKGVNPSEFTSKLVQLLDGAFSRYDSRRVEISKLVPSKVEQARGECSCGQCKSCMGM
jgi:hypothetical protein